MEHSLPSSTFFSLSLLPPTSGASPVVPALNLVAITQKELTRLKWEGTYWKAQHQRACEREVRLKEELEQKEALIRDLRHRLFGKKSETGGAQQAIEQQPTQALHRPRGQQRGAVVTDVLSVWTFPSSKNAMSFRGSSVLVPSVVFLISPFPVMKNRIFLRLRSRRTAVGSIANAIRKAARVPRRRTVLQLSSRRHQRKSFREVPMGPQSGHISS